MASVSVTYRLPAELADRIAAEAGPARGAKTALVRDILERHFASGDRPAPVEPEPAPEPRPELPVPEPPADREARIAHRVRQLTAQGRTSSAARREAEQEFAIQPTDGGA